MADWSDLREELDRWQGAGSAATFWWRDDDAEQPSAALDRLFDLQTRTNVPLCLAVVPAEVSPALARQCERGDGVQVVQHGYAHRNNAAAGVKKTELVGSVDDRLRELADGLAGLEALFGPRLEKVLVPPWNRIDAALLPHLAEIGFGGLSTYGPRPGREAAPGLRQTNAHCDPVNWRDGRGFVGLDEAVRQICEHLALRRQGVVDAAEPTGLLTHHLVMDTETWRFVEQFMATVSAHPAAQWLSSRQALFGAGGVNLHAAAAR